MGTGEGAAGPRAEKPHLAMVPRKAGWGGIPIPCWASVGW